MTYNPTTGGHAPGDLRDAFLVMVEDISRRRGVGGVAASLNNEPICPRDLCGRLWNCSDIMPGSDAQAIDLPSGSSYAQAARKLRALV